MFLNIKSLLKYFGIFIVIFTALSAASFTTPVQKAVNEIYTSTHLDLYKKMMPDIRIKFNPMDGNNLDWGSFNFEFNSFETEKKMIAEARQKQLTSIDIPMESAVFHLDLIYTPFFIFLLSLLIATPLPSVKNKLIAFAWGFGIFFIFQFFRVYLKMLQAVNQYKIGVYEYEGFKGDMLFYASYISHAGFATMIVLLIWGLVIFNKENTAFIHKKIGLS